MDSLTELWIILGMVGMLLILKGLAAYCVEREAIRRMESRKSADPIRAERYPLD